MANAREFLAEAAVVRARVEGSSRRSLVAYGVMQGTGRGEVSSEVMPQPLHKLKAKLKI